MSYDESPTVGRQSQLPEATGRFFANDVDLAIKEAASALWFDDSADYGPALWSVLKALLPASEVPQEGDDKRLRELAGFADTEDSP